MNNNPIRHAVIVGSALAYLVLSVLLALTGPDAVEHGWWRAAFVLGALFGLVALWIRSGSQESPEFVGAKGKPTGQWFWPMVVAHGRSMGVVLCVTAGATTVFYFCTTQLGTYAISWGMASRHDASNALLVGLLVLLASMLVSGAVADRIGPLLVLRLGFLGMAVSVVPLFMSLMSGRVDLLAVATVLLALLGMPLGVSNVFAGRLFPPRTRAVAMGLPMALAVSVFGGALPALVEWLRSIGMEHLVPGWIVFVCATAFAASLAVRPSLEHPKGDSHRD